MRRILVGVALLALVGCGSDEGSSPNPIPASADTAPAKSASADHGELVAQMNTLCESANAKLGKANADVTAATSETAAISALDDALAVYEEVVPQLEALDPPPADQAAFESFVRAISRNESIVRRMGDAARAGDSVEIAALNTAADAETDRRLSAALDLGADECGRSLTR